jgi:lysophospholipase L1-like esterase
MKAILCYGDSNTWGSDPVTDERFPPEVRWTGVQAGQLGSGYHVIEEGLPGRTTVWDDPVEGLHKNGRNYLLPCLESHQPIDLVILMLGTNDLKQRFSVPAADIAASVGTLVDIIQKSATGAGEGSPQVLLIAPSGGKLTEVRRRCSSTPVKSGKFAEYYRASQRNMGAGSSILADDRPSELDGIHFEAEQHARLGKAVAQRVKGILES